MRKSRTRVSRFAGSGLAFDDGARREQFAFVAAAFVENTRGDRLWAFQTPSRIEIGGLPTGVQVSIALRAGAFETDIAWNDRAACRALDLLAVSHHAW